ncbi:MAG: acyl carrier protein [Deltaproteobacteria bacterium]|nr:acyl carrier protein [Deltaproteobacteria bacterium]
MTITREFCLTKIVAYIRDNYVADAGLFLPMDSSLLEAGILDSYAVVELITYLEAEFDLRIPEEDFTKEKLGSIQKMADYVVTHKLPAGAQ